MKTAIDSQITTDEKFFGQLEEFCRLVQEEFLARFNEIGNISNSIAQALEFTETLMLCPTRDAAQASIGRELPAALSFVLAVQRMQRQLQLGTFKLPVEVPEYQTHFYLLASALQEYLQLEVSASDSLSRSSCTSVAS